MTEDRRSFEERNVDVLKRLCAASGGRPINVLALSGGGAGAAFGAGSLVGWTGAGTRPEFELVTGVSAGALIAPFAFLGPDWDGQLTKSFSGQESARLLRLKWSGLFFGSSPFRGKPLHDLVYEYATDEMMRAVAAEASKGRILFVATTDLEVY
jgi:predicted acylesterase/phospholipase RssA